MTLRIRLHSFGLLLAISLFLFVFGLQAACAASGEDENTGAAKAAVIRGRASWYGREHQGQATSSGERFNRFKYTCAHRSLPFGTRLRVTNPDNGKAVVVRVTDRGPFRHQRVLDLSEVAARPLDIVQHGAVDVVAEIVAEDTPLGPTEAPNDLEALLLATDTTQTLASAPVEVVMAAAAPAVATKLAFIVQAGTFSDAHNAQGQLTKIQKIDASLPATIEAETASEKALNRVLVGQFDTWSNAKKVRRQLKQHGINALVRRVPAAATPVQVAAK
ncbi:septal ring lytic transglycosylase RlpA family protein [Hymenobacter sp. GOD-10R]|uniref:septal ring lytic transglycosylase RlpA family protein n=1 Tax=Hymenobacter sp. GOD-10R TaxID=3093922 RepID=UPI002D7890DF|nr:septal ring lytic transglycosylase RlpA family protein [Hymenobacter sp. GOD-10R]WRQ28187.1 septal ring lytic transglycosylase RlpA family protein [Hymenobacter sp. GOD-10R]